MVLYAPYSASRYKRDKEREETLEKLVTAMRSGTETPGHCKSRTRKAKKLSAWINEWTAPQDHRVKGIIQAHVCEPGGPYLEPIVLPERPDTTFEDSMEYVRKWLQPSACQDTEKRGGELAQTRFSDPNAAQQFLYSAALFRESRHFAALLSEATYPCPCRYNTRGEDNDWHRFHHVLNWLDQLNRDGKLLFRKPGGFAWMYRDTRLGIQRLAEALPSATFGDDSILAVQGRARIHYWIGDWYGRAYHSTGHVMPLLESVYHYRQCLRYVRAAKPRSITEPSVALASRRRLARRAIFALIKTLQHGRERTIEFWLQEGAGDPWFSLRANGSGRNLLRELGATFATLDNRQNNAPDFAWQEWLAELEQELRRLPQLHLPQITDASARAAGIHHTLFPSADIHHIGIDSTSEANWRRLLQRQVLPKLATAFARDKQPQISARPQNNGWSELLRLLDEHGGGGSSVAESTFDLNKGLHSWRDRWLPRLQGDRGRVETVARTIFDIAYLHVRRAKLAHHADSGAQSQLLPKQDIACLWVQACGLCWLVLDLCAELPPVALNVDLELRIAASTIYGLALGRLGRFFEAHRRLNEAHAILFAREWGASASPELAKIKLRRAEIHLLEGRLLHQMLRSFTRVGDNSVSFVELLQQHARGSRSVAEQWVQIHLPETCTIDDAIRELTRQHYAKLDDAWLSLDTAQRCLKATHAALWWGRLYTLRHDL